MLRLLCVGAAFSILVASCGAAQAAEIGQPAGAVALRDAAGQELVVRDYSARAATAFVFLSARSDAVRKSIEEINRLYRKHRRLRVLYVGVCPNDVETPAELRTFAQHSGMIFSIQRDPGARAARLLGVSAVPSVVLVDSEGRIAHRGGLESEDARIAFDAALMSRAKPAADEDDDEPPPRPTPIGRPGPQHDTPDPYGAPAFSSELVFEKIEGAPAHHCSTITFAPAGDLLCLWYGGSYESADDQALFLARRAKGERTWQPPQVLVQNPEHPPGNAVLFVDGRARVWIVWCRMENPRPMPRGSGWNNCRLMFRTSDDDGRTWSADREFLGDELRGVPRNPPVRLANGDLVLAVEGRLKDQRGSLFLLGAEGGTRWSLGGLTTGGSQPAVVQRRDGSLFALLRRAPRLPQIESRDGGRTWSAPVPSKIRNPGAGISLTRLAGGHLILVFNDSDQARTPLSVARSLDEGLTWETPLHLESNPGEYSYPCVIATPDGRIHVSYTFRRYAIKHAEFNEDWLVHLERPN
jgi:predicted neuraminidase